MQKIKLMKNETAPAEFNPKTVNIGGHVWMAEDLMIPAPNDGSYAFGGTTYYTAAGIREVLKQIPGWHLPTLEECDALIATTVDSKGMPDERKVRAFFKKFNPTTGGYFSRNTREASGDMSYRIEDPKYSLLGQEDYRVTYDGPHYRTDEIPVRLVKDK